MSVLLRKAQGGSGVGPYFWEHDGDVVEVSDDVAMDLLRIPGGGYSVAQPGDDPAQSAGHGHEQEQADAGSGGGPSVPAADPAEASEAGDDEAGSEPGDDAAAPDAEPAADTPADSEPADTQEQ